MRTTVERDAAVGRLALIKERHKLLMLEESELDDDLDDQLDGLLDDEAFGVLE
jgi:hypothetical protein